MLGQEDGELKGSNLSYTARCLSKQVSRLRNYIRYVLFEKSKRCILCMSALPVCMHVYHMCALCQKRAWDALELELL